MQWWAWIAVGAILLGSELTLVNAQFYLVFLGFSALIVGLLALGGMLGPAWLEWLAFALMAVVSMFAFRRQLYERTRRRLPVLHAGPAGETVLVPADLPPGETCRLEYRGSSWSALNGGHCLIAAGSVARIARVDGLTLIVHPIA